METTTTAATATTTHENQFLESNDLLNYDLTNHQDMLLYSSLYSTSPSATACHPLDSLSSKQQEINTPLTSSSSINPFLESHFQNMENLYTNSTTTSPSYLQYLQQSPMDDYQQQQSSNHLENTNSNNNNNNLHLFDTKATNWMMDHLNIYMPLSTTTNDSSQFNLNNLSYLSQMKSDHPQELNDIPHNYVHLNDVNSFVMETDAMKHNASLQSNNNNNNNNTFKSFTLMGELSPSTPSTNNSGMPPTPYTTMQQRGSYDSIDSIDDFSDSDTSSQSWLLSSSSQQQDSMHGWRDPNQSSIYSSLGLSSSISTPTLSLNHQQNYDLSMNPSFYYQHHPSALPPQYHYSTTNTTTTKNKSMKKGNHKHLLKTRRSIPNDFLINNRQGLNLHYQQMNRKKSMPNLYYHPSLSSSTTTTTASPIHKAKSSSSMNKRSKELKRRESEPHSLNKLNQQHLSSTMMDPSLYSPSIITTNNLSNSESLSHFLSRQKLTDDDDIDDGDLQENSFLLSTSNDHPHPPSYQNYNNTDNINNNNNNNNNTVQQLTSSSSSSTIASNTTSTNNHNHNHNNNPSIKKGRNVDKACNHCKRSHLRCDNMRPCRRCISTGKTGCKDVMHKPRGRPKLHKN
ncbi:unnamed protein product [Cunninghamella blakesleeana]